MPPGRGGGCCCGDSAAYPPSRNISHSTIPPGFIRGWRYVANRWVTKHYRFVVVDWSTCPHEVVTVAGDVWIKNNWPRIVRLSKRCSYQTPRKLLPDQENKTWSEIKSMYQ